MREVLHRRPVLFDIAVVFFPVAVLVCVGSDEFLRRLLCRFSPDERLPRVIGSIAGSIVITVLSYQLGDV